MKTKELNDLSVFDQFIIKDKKAKSVRTGVAYGIIYTRVSSKEQFEHNGSIESQERLCDRLAQQRSIPILERFGGTYESAKSEDRKEFKRMMDFIRTSKENIKYIIVSDNDRFSRTGANAISVADKLRSKYGIQILAASAPVDTTTPFGAFQQNMQLLWSHMDNQFRKEKTVRGMMQKFEQGYYIGSLPKGYERVPGTGTIVQDEFAPAIAKAFKWKAEQGLRTSEISEKLERLGFIIHEKRLSYIFRNVFYCGLLTNSMLGDKIVEGTNWEPLVSKETFLQANNVLKQNYTTYNHHKEDINIPLRRFVACGRCKTMWTGYVVKRKGIYYYKCNTKGCKCNMSATKMHKQFVDELAKYQIQDRHIEPLKKQLELTFEYLNQSLFTQKAELQKRRQDVQAKIYRAEEKYIEENLDSETYMRYKQKCEDELTEIGKEEQLLHEPLSNSKKLIDFSVEICRNLSEMWASSGLTDKMKLQKMMFPDGVEYDMDFQCYRTPRINSLILEIAGLARVSAENEKRNPPDKLENSVRVPRAGIEPARYLSITGF